MLMNFHQEYLKYLVQDWVQCQEKKQLQETSMWVLCQRFRRDECGTTSIEYSMIAILVSVFVIGAVSQLGGNVLTLFTTVSSKL
jgi:pilus assembly protein Flp/PilA